MKAVCILTTAPTLSCARKLAAGLLAARLAACITLIPHVESHYVWKGRRMRSKETQLVIKTRAGLFKKIETFFKKEHPYQVPELIALPISRGSVPYLKWLNQAVSV